MMISIFWNIINCYIILFIIKIGINYSIIHIINDYIIMFIFVKHLLFI